MDVNTGHLITRDERQRLMDAFSNDEKHMKEIMDSYVPVPDELHKAAKLKLAGKEEVMVSLTSGGKLSRWAAKERSERRSKNKQKMQKESRKRNRR